MALNHASNHSDEINGDTFTSELFYQPPTSFQEAKSFCESLNVAKIGNLVNWSIPKVNEVPLKSADIGINTILALDNSGNVVVIDPVTGRVINNSKIVNLEKSRLGRAVCIGK